MRGRDPSRTGSARLKPCRLRSRKAEGFITRSDVLRRRFPNKTRFFHCVSLRPSFRCRRPSDRCNSPASRPGWQFRRSSFIENDVDPVPWPSWSILSIRLLEALQCNIKRVGFRVLYGRFVRARLTRCPGRVLAWCVRRHERCTALGDESLRRLAILVGGCGTHAAAQHVMDDYPGRVLAV